MPAEGILLTNGCPGTCIFYFEAVGMEGSLRIAGCIASSFAPLKGRHRQRVESSIHYQ